MRPGHTGPLCGAGSHTPIPCGQWGATRNFVPAWGEARQTRCFEEMVFAAWSQEPPSKRPGSHGAMVGRERLLVTHLPPGSVEEEAIESYAQGDQSAGQPITGGFLRL